MPFALIAKIAIQVLAGLGIGNLLDKFVRPKVPAYYPEPIVSGSLKPQRIMWIVIAFVIAIFTLRWAGKTLNIQILKRI